MVFNSFQFIWLFPIIFVGYYLLSYMFANRNPERQRKVSNAFLLIVSYCLYAQTNIAYTLILLGVTAVTYVFALLIEQKESDKRKYLITCGATLALLPLLVFKYYDLSIQAIHSLRVYIVLLCYLDLIGQFRWVYRFLHFRPLVTCLTFITNASMLNTIGLITCFLFLFFHKLCQVLSAMQRICCHK